MQLRMPPPVQRPRQQQQKMGCQSMLLQQQGRSASMEQWAALVMWRVQFQQMLLMLQVLMRRDAVTNAMVAGPSSVPVAHLAQLQSSSSSRA
jgi:hypothetical protein